MSTDVWFFAFWQSVIPLQSFTLVHSKPSPFAGLCRQSQGLRRVKPDHDSDQIVETPSVFFNDDNEALIAPLTLFTIIALLAARQKHQRYRQW
ncbi:hypothetical protein [Pantoea sp. AS142]|uniref:hypothetical protein n=1 Tax=Pantoea sp. AS142 TaxID=3081292 RepID=UPI003018A967